MVAVSALRRPNKPQKKKKKEKKKGKGEEQENAMFLANGRFGLCTWLSNFFLLISLGLKNEKEAGKRSRQNLRVVMR